MSDRLLGKTGEQLLTATERMKWLSQSRNNAQLWMCLVKSNVVKKNMECYVHESRQIGGSQVGDGKNEHQNLRNQ